MSVIEMLPFKKKPDKIIFGLSIMCTYLHLQMKPLLLEWERRQRWSHWFFLQGFSSLGCSDLYAHQQRSINCTKFVQKWQRMLVFILLKVLHFRQKLYSLWGYIKTWGCNIFNVDVPVVNVDGERLGDQLRHDCLVPAKELMSLQMNWNKWSDNY